MKLTKDTLIEGLIYKKGTTISIKEWDWDKPLPEPNEWSLRDVENREWIKKGDYITLEGKRYYVQGFSTGKRDPYTGTSPIIYKLSPLTAKGKMDSRKSPVFIEVDEKGGEVTWQRSGRNKRRPVQENMEKYTYKFIAQDYSSMEELYYWEDSFTLEEITRIFNGYKIPNYPHLLDGAILAYELEKEAGLIYNKDYSYDRPDEGYFFFSDSDLNSKFSKLNLTDGSVLQPTIEVISPEGDDDFDDYIDELIW